MVFNRQIGEPRSHFRCFRSPISSDVLMYDRETQSLWSQLAMKAVAGPKVKTALAWLPSEQITWKEWQQKYPNDKVLSTQTGHDRDYQNTPYQSYENSPEVMFPVPTHRQELPRKAWVLGVIVNGEAKAYPLDKLPPRQSINDTVGGTSIHVYYDPAARTATITNERGEIIQGVMSYWFAWQAFYPHTGLWSPQPQP